MLQITGHSLVYKPFISFTNAHNCEYAVSDVSEKHGFHVKQERLLLTK